MGALLLGLAVGRAVRRNRDGALLAAATELDRALGDREDRVVAADADAVAGAELRAALPHDDVAGLDLLAAEHLHAETLRVRVAAVPGGTEALLVCHLALLLLGERRLERRECALPLR